MSSIVYYDYMNICVDIIEGLFIETTTSHNTYIYVKYIYKYTKITIR